MKRLLCLISGMNTGGAETFLIKIYRQLDKSKYQMDFCVNINEPGVYDEEIKAMGGKMFYVPPKSENLRAFKEGLSKVVKENNYKYILRITSNAAGFLDLRIAKKAGAEVCVARSSNSSDGTNIVANLIHRYSRATLVKYVDRMIAPSDLAARYTFGDANYENGRVRILHNGLDLTHFQYNEIDRKRIREEFGILENVRVYGHVGRLSHQKNHKFLIEIFKQIYVHDPKAILMLVGTGELENEIRTQVEELGLKNNVIFAGVRMDIPSLLSAMDIFVFPSFYEGMPNTVIEAQATGLPCIVADTITKEANITGLVKYLSLDCRDEWVSCLEDSIHGRITDNEVIKRIFIKENYDMESVVRDFLQIVFMEEEEILWR